MYGVETLDGFGRFGRGEIAAAGALAAYIDLTQKGRAPPLQPPRRLAEDGVMEIDPATRRNLELTRTLSGERQGSLLARRSTRPSPRRVRACWRAIWRRR